MNGHFNNQLIRVGNTSHYIEFYEGHRNHLNQH
jgi:hypothetical protein